MILYRMQRQMQLQPYAHVQNPCSSKFQMDIITSY